MRVFRDMLRETPVRALVREADAWNMSPHTDPLAHPDPDRHPTHGPMGALYVAVYLTGFFLLMPAFAIATFTCLINRWLFPSLICFAAVLFFGAIARAAWRRMP
jgi:hypothetical protein